MLNEYIKKVTGEDFDNKFPVPCPPKHAVRDYLTSSLEGLLDEIEKDYIEWVLAQSYGKPYKGKTPFSEWKLKAEVKDMSNWD